MSPNAAALTPLRDYPLRFGLCNDCHIGDSICTVGYYTFRLIMLSCEFREDVMLCTLRREYLVANTHHTPAVLRRVPGCSRRRKDYTVTRQTCICHLPGVCHTHSGHISWAPAISSRKSLVLALSAQSLRVRFPDFAVNEIEYLPPSCYTIRQKDWLLYGWRHTCCHICHCG